MFEFPIFENIRVVNGNDQSTGYTQNDVIENNYVSIQAHASDSYLRWSWATGAGGGDDILDIRGGTRGILRGGEGNDVFLIRPGASGDFWLSGFDLSNDTIVVVGEQDSISFSEQRIASDYYVRIDNVRFRSEFSLSELATADALLVADSSPQTGVVDGLQDVGDAFADQVILNSLGLFGAAASTFGDGADFVDLSRDLYFSGSVGLGTDTILISATAGGYVGLGGSASVAPTVVYTWGGDRITIPGSSGSADYEADILILSSAAQGEWMIGQTDPYDRIVLMGFDDINTLSDLQLRTFETETTSIRYELAEGLTLLTPIDATQMTLLDGIALRGNGHLQGADDDDVLFGGSGSDMLQGFGGSDRLDGGGGTDTLIGGAGDDFIFGGDSEADLRDVVYGGAGNDSIHGGYGNDELRGDAGNDSIEGGFGVDTVIGGEGDDVLTGSAWSDEIFGSNGNDFINGGFGHDRVNGGEGADKFYHLGIFDHGSDWIQDYSAAQGDLLMWGGAAATVDDFQINTADTANAGVDGVSESFIIYRPTGQIMWALVDGDAQSAINLQIGGDVFDLLL